VLHSVTRFRAVDNLVTAFAQCVDAEVVLRGAHHDVSQRDFSAIRRHEQIQNVLPLGFKVGGRSSAVPRLQVVLIWHVCGSLLAPVLDMGGAQIEKARRWRAFILNALSDIYGRPLSYTLIATNRALLQVRCEIPLKGMLPTVEHCLGR
jgi:hypothetical protein